VGWAFVWMMVILKIPIIGLCWIVWRAIKAEPVLPEEAPADSGGGGTHHPRPRRPRPPRRGPHGEPLPQPPARVRAVACEGIAVR
jgi:hypothetical protein